MREGYGEDAFYKKRLPEKMVPLKKRGVNMKIKIEKSKASGIVKAPPSKSAAHRLLICGALAGKGSFVDGVAYSKDIEATLACIKALGMEYEINGDKVSLLGQSYNGNEETVLNCNESGSTLRFFIPIALAVGGKFKFVGSERLMERPLGVYEEIFKEQGISFKREKCSIALEGKLKGGEYKVRGDVSSQFITGLLLALPLVGGGIVEVIPPVESRPYIEMTLSSMIEFGITVERTGENTYKVSGEYKPTESVVEGDHSNAAFLDAFTLAGGDVQVTGLRADSLQGDKIYREYFEKIKNGYCTLDISDTPDLGPVLMAVGAIYDGVELTGTRRLKIKESDRGEVMRRVLGEFSVPVEVYEDRIVVAGRRLHPPSRPLDGYRDHRIVMSEAVLMSCTGGEIHGAETVSKSYPDFFEVIGGLGIKYKVTE